jgi:hypothetical protein
MVTTRKDVASINWSDANNWQTMLREMNRQITPIVAAIRSAQGRLDKSVRKTGPASDSLNFNLGRLKGRLRYWKSTVYEALSRYEYTTPTAPPFVTAAFGIVAQVQDPPLPPVIQSQVLNPDVTRGTLAALQEGFNFLRQAIANMRQGIDSGTTRTTAAAARAEAATSAPDDAFNRPTFGSVIPWGYIVLGGVALYWLRREK